VGIKKQTYTQIRQILSKEEVPRSTFDSSLLLKIYYRLPNTTPSAEIFIITVIIHYNSSLLLFSRPFGQRDPTKNRKANKTVGGGKKYRQLF